MNDRATLLRGATILTMDPAVGDLDRGDLYIEDGRISAVAASIELDEGVRRDADVVDATGRIVIPGFVDTHRHMWEVLVRGGAPHHTLEQYYLDVLGTAGSGVLPGDVHLGTLASARSALLAGITTVQDISNIQHGPAHTDASVAALRESGIRAVFAYGKSFAMMTRDGGALGDDVRRVRSRLLPDDGADVTMALLTEWADDDGERHNAALARDLGVRTARHVGAETPISRLRDLGVLLAGTTFIHGNGLSPDELRIIADTGGTLSVAPAIELMMGHGVPMLGLSPHGLPLSLSTSAEVTVASDMFTQMRAALQSGRTFGRGAHSGRELTARDVLALATREGAAALGLGARTGSLTPGKDADVVVLRADDLDVSPVVDPVSTVVLQMDRRHIDRVYRAGRVVVRDGASAEDSRELVAGLVAAAARLGPVPRSPLRAGR
ncbi:cytosine/adenosine deaminase-related metal-dependent hydrolase [Catenuloplanes nepalensis]|uniref:Cytosine/adenosine deaminase-related metal-dependent hydrolase n=1 Tax=Catenuloplanes nepalensis TaxID=587533 RepID=A0ABT9MP07_9ACTN|nr:amidohydrolase family protein [Catenuloplanes nepalensis]MDP9793155.1 cytosine/adenosine deaminase-related metal-dependent hydrolase [Catenuloplanes nepalensis]